MLLLLLSSGLAMRAVVCANHSLQSSFEKNFSVKLIAFWHLNMDFTIFFNVILTDLSKRSLSFKTKT